MEDINRMSINQMRFLVYLYDHLDQRAIVAGKKEGAIIKELHRKKYVRPIGKHGRSLIWALNKKMFKSSDIKLMKQLMREVDAEEPFARSGYGFRGVMLLKLGKQSKLKDKEK
jgi:hypothetical protein